MVQVPRDIFEMVLRFILDADIDKEAFEHKVHAISDPEARNNAMSLAQQYRQEGRQEGLVGQIRLLQRFMGMEMTPGAELLLLDFATLQRRYDALESAYNQKFKDR